jgi:hypothetical protein
MNRTFLDLISEDQLATVTVAIESTVAKSFDADYSRVTRDEIRHRFAICERIIRELRGDLKWTLTRVLDAMPRYLRCELDGSHWTPDERAVWMPEQLTTQPKE